MIMLSFILQYQKNGQYLVFSNLFSFQFLLGREAKLEFKTILFCLNEMNVELDPIAIKAFCALDVFQLMKNWLIELQTFYDASIGMLFLWTNFCNFGSFWEHFIHICSAFVIFCDIFILRNFSNFKSSLDASLIHFSLHFPCSGSTILIPIRNTKISRIISTLHG